MSDVAFIQSVLAERRRLAAIVEHLDQLLRVYNTVAPGSLPAVPKLRLVPGKIRSAVRRRFTDFKPLHPETVNGLPPDHPAILEKRTLFPTTVKRPDEVDRVLVSGANNRKLGDRIIKGSWAGYPIYHLTLEERATCPDSCFLYSRCYGSGMPQARRHGTDGLMPVLERELVALQQVYPQGFAIRLHTLGDFFSIDYVRFWERMLDQLPALHVFGYTAREKDTEIGAALWQITQTCWDRFAIRWSADDGAPQGSTTIFRIPDAPRVPEGIVCPAETGKTNCCGTCGLCWSKATKDQAIVFIAHGPAFRHDNAPSGLARPGRQARAKDAVFAAVQTLNARHARASMNTTAIETGYSPQTCIRVLHELESEGKVHKVGRGRGSDWRAVAQQDIAVVA